MGKDVEWMKRVGIVGLQNFDANINTPQNKTRKKPTLGGQPTC